ncbi:MAG: hypothetical protein K0A94_12215 [Desulfuromonadales bacterium]|nr:hypothetical protein [Desulfuromonadales bacterium]
MVQNEYRLDKDKLLDNLRAWNRVLRRKVQLIACGGTAMTLLGVKASTKDVDFMVPDVREYNYLIKQLPAMGYTPTTGPGWQRKGEAFHYDLFRATTFTQLDYWNRPWRLDETNDLLNSRTFILAS